MIRVSIILNRNVSNVGGCVYGQVGGEWIGGWVYVYLYMGKGKEPLSICLGIWCYENHLLIDQSKFKVVAMQNCLYFPAPFQVPSGSVSKLRSVS